MKAVLALLCSLVFLVTPMLAARPSVCPAKPAAAHCHAACCRPGHEMSCCLAQPASNPPAHAQPAPVNNARAGSLNDFSLLTLALLTSAAPVAEVRPPSVPAFSTRPANTAPLCARHCVWLI